MSSTKKVKGTKRQAEDAPLNEREQKLLAMLHEKFKSRLANVSEVVLVRFIRGFDYFEKPEEKTLEMMDKYLKWRESMGVDALGTTELKNSEIFKQEYPCGLHGVDKQGHLIYIDRPGQIDPKGLAKKFSEEDVVRFHIQRQEQTLNARNALNQSAGAKLYKNVVIIDLKGFGTQHLAKQFRSTLKKCIDIDQDFYPETLHMMFVVNAPWAFRALWKAVSPWVDPVTRERIHFGKDMLLKYIDRHHLPRFLGGTCKCKDGKCLVAPYEPGNPGEGGNEPLEVEKDEMVGEATDPMSPEGINGGDDKDKDEE